MVLSNRFRILAWFLSIAGGLIGCIGLILWALDIQKSADVPIYAPFLESFRFLILAGGVLLVLSASRIEDEFISSLRLLAFKYAMIITAILVIVNQLFYFFTNNLWIQAIDMVIFQVWMQYVIYQILFRRAAL